SSTIRQADRIYVVSPYVREEIISRFHIPAARVRVTCNGVGQKQPEPDLRDRLRKDHELQDRRLLLYVGSIFNRRRLPLLIEAISGLSPDCVLVIIGENRTHPREDLAAVAVKFGVQERVRILNYVDDQTLDAYYKMA